MNPYFIKTRYIYNFHLYLYYNVVIMKRRKRLRRVFKFDLNSMKRRKKENMGVRKSEITL